MTRPKGSTSGERLRSLRVGLGVSREGLARSSGVSASSLQRWERRGLEASRLLDVVRVAWALGVSAAELVPALAADPLRPGAVQLRQAQGDEARRLVRDLRAQVAARLDRPGRGKASTH